MVRVTDSYPIRAITAAQAEDFMAVMSEAFHAGEPLSQLAARELTLLEPERTAAAFDGDRIVGSAAAFTMTFSVPGGTAAVAGITDVAVRPAYRRRGIMSAMMRGLLADGAARGEPLAALFASESGIYRRLGFGCAAEELSFTVRRGEGRLTAPPSPVPGVRVADPASARAELAAVYGAVGSARPGMPARDDRWWEKRTTEPEYRRGNAAPLRCVIAGDAGGPRGYALYSAAQHWGEHGIAASTLTVRELVSADPAASAVLWADLLSRDLVAEVRVDAAPVDDPLLQLLDDRRRARAVLGDNLWVRVLDVAAALAGRRYARAVDAVLEVTDDILPANAGRWRLRAGPDGAAACERVTAPADVIVPAAALGAVYLGGTRLGALAAAGQVVEVRPGAVAALSAALTWDPAPFCPMIF
jgi:predicted acetyltransferase